MPEESLRQSYPKWLTVKKQASFNQGFAAKGIFMPYRRRQGYDMVHGMDPIFSIATLASRR
jgi:hypothetical protein